MGNLFDEFMKAAQKDPALKGKIKGIAVINDDGLRNVLKNPAQAMKDLEESSSPNSEKPADGITHIIKKDGVGNFIEKYQDGDIDKLAKS
ncbi:MAG: hypothetical protein JST32_09120 [Bacteroidetes bacterium]|nr:hypothetical protein [Bacteroidota bacterium]